MTTTADPALSIGPLGDTSGKGSRIQERGVSEAVSISSWEVNGRVRAQIDGQFMACGAALVGGPSADGVNVRVATTSIDPSSIEVVDIAGATQVETMAVRS
jgi:hypothetical protein